MQYIQACKLQRGTKLLASKAVLYLKNPTQFFTKWRPPQLPQKWKDRFMVCVLDLLDAHPKNKKTMLEFMNYSRFINSDLPTYKHAMLHALHFLIFQSLHIVLFFLSNKCNWHIKIAPVTFWKNIYAMSLRIHFQKILPASSYMWFNSPEYCLVEGNKAFRIVFYLFWNSFYTWLLHISAAFI
jgi:hypothetical protein